MKASAALCVVVSLLAVGPALGYIPFMVVNKDNWWLASGNRVVVDYNNDWSGAIPYGSYLNQFSGWQPYKWPGFGWQMTQNGYTILSYHFDFYFQCRGAYNGVGAMITGLGAYVTDLSVWHGYSFASNFTVWNPANVGTDSWPVAAVTAQVAFSFSGPGIYGDTRVCQVAVKGDCSASIITCN